MAIHVLSLRDNRGQCHPNGFQPNTRSCRSRRALAILSPISASPAITQKQITLARPWFGEEENAAVRRVFASGWVVQGPEVAAFEQAVAAIHQMPHAVAVSSATAGLHLMYLALGIGPGDVVLIPSFAWPSAANMAARVGAVPFFVDVDPGTYNLTAPTLKRGLQQVRERNLGRPRAVVVVHEFGLPAPMAELLAAARHKLLVIEDAAQAIGSEYKGRRAGSISHYGCFSFFPSKNLGCAGDGGLVTTNDNERAEKLRIYRAHGSKPKYFHNVIGGNFRLDALQAAIVEAKLPHLDGWTSKRQANAPPLQSTLRQVRPCGTRIGERPGRGSAAQAHLQSIRAACAASRRTSETPRCGRYRE